MNRRSFIRSTTSIASTMLLSTSPLISLAHDRKSETKVGVEEVSPIEDLMREHGALNRMLLIYGETLRRLYKKESMDPALLQETAQLIRSFIEEYHEKLEEEFIFPKLKFSGRLVDTVEILLVQHRAGRKLTETIIRLSNTKSFQNPTDITTLKETMQSFIHMYRPHEAREDTVVFPEFKKIITLKEYNELGDIFEDREHKLFGKAGFDGIVAKIATIEKALGIYDLAQFTPKT